MKAFLSRFSLKERLGLFIALTILFLAFVDRLIINPIINRIHQINNEIVTDERQLRLNLSRLKQKEVVAEKYKKYSQYVKKVGTDEEEQTKILSEIEELARKSNISISNMKPQSPKEISFYKKYEIEIEVEGEMESLVNFLYEINNSSQLLRAKRVTFGLKENKSSVVKASVTVTKIVVP